MAVFFATWWQGIIFGFVITVVLLAIGYAFTVMWRPYEDKKEKQVYMSTAHMTRTLLTIPTDAKPITDCLNSLLDLAPVALLFSKKLEIMNESITACYPRPSSGRGRTGY